MHFSVPAFIYFSLLLLASRGSWSGALAGVPNRYIGNKNTILKRKLAGLDRRFLVFLQRRARCQRSALSLCRNRAGLVLRDEVDADAVAEGVGDAFEHAEAVAIAYRPRFCLTNP